MSRQENATHNTLEDAVLAALLRTHDAGYTIEERAEAIAAAVRVENDTLRARLAACEQVVEAAEAWADHDDDGGEPDQALWQAVCEMRLTPAKEETDDGMDH